VGQLASGNIPGAISAIGSRITGLGLAAGVGISAAVLLLQKFRTEANAARDSVKNINRELADPEEIQGGLGSGVGAVIDRQRKLLEDLQAKLNTTGGKLLDLSSRRSYLKASGVFTDEEINQREQEGPAFASQLLADRITELTKKRASFESAITEAKIKALSGDKLSATLTQDQLSAEQAIAELRERAGKDDTFVLENRLAQDVQQVNRLKAIQDAVARRQEVGDQQGVFQKATAGFDARTAANTEQFLRDKIAADPFNPRNSRFQLQADQLGLFRQQQELGQNQFIDDSMIAGGSVGARVFQENLRQKIAAQQQGVDATTARVYGEQRQFDQGSDGTNARLDKIIGLMIETWK